MSKAWKIILTVVMIAILIGAVCVGVGLITGGEWERIHASLDARYHLDMYWRYALEVIQKVQETLMETPA